MLHGNLIWVLLLKRNSDLEEDLRKEFTLNVRIKCTSGAFKSPNKNWPIGRNFLNKRKGSVNSYEKGKTSLRQRDF